MQKKLLSVSCLSIATLAILIFQTGCFPSCCVGLGSGIRGNGKLKTVERAIGTFSEVEFETVGRVNIKIGSPSSVSISGDENLVELVETDVRANRLYIGGKKNFYPKQNLVITVTTPSVNVIESDGAGSIYASQLSNDTLQIDQGGVGSIQVTGATNKLHVDVSGAGSVDAEGLKAKSVEANLSGVGSVKVNAELELKARVSGVGSITYTGDPKVESQVSGVGSIRKK